MGEPKHFEDVPGAPSHLDFRESGQVTGVKNQGQCGSCWAFSSTGCLEGMWKKNHGQLISLSEQQMVDCAPGSCQGGWMHEAWNAVRNGIETEQTYPYTARDGWCHANSNNFVVTNSGSRRSATVSPRSRALSTRLAIPSPWLFMLVLPSSITMEEFSATQAASMVR